MTCPESGRGPITGTLDTAAVWFAKEVASSGQVSHTGADGSALQSRAASNGIQSLSVIETIYLGGRNGPEGAVQRWPHSPIHCQLMTDPRSSAAGASVVSGNQGSA